MSRPGKTEARRIEAEMYEIYLQRGPQTKDDLLALGYSQDEIDAHGPAVARRIREAELA